MRNKRARQIRKAATVAITRGLIDPKDSKNFYRYLKRAWVIGQWNPNLDNTLKQS